MANILIKNCIMMHVIMTCMTCAIELPYTGSKSTLTGIFRHV